MTSPQELNVSRRVASVPSATRRLASVKHRDAINSPPPRTHLSHFDSRRPWLPNKLPSAPRAAHALWRAARGQAARRIKEPIYQLGIGSKIIEYNHLPLRAPAAGARLNRASNCPVVRVTVDGPTPSRHTPLTSPAPGKWDREACGTALWSVGTKPGD